MAKRPKEIIGITKINIKFGKTEGSLPPRDHLADYFEAILRFFVEGSESGGDPRMIILRTTEELHRLTQEGDAGEWFPVKTIRANSGINPPVKGGYTSSGLWYYLAGRVDTVLEVKKSNSNAISFVPNSITKGDSVRINPDCINPIGIALSRTPMERILRLKPWITG